MAGEAMERADERGDAGRAVLAGIRVVDLSTLLPGPYCTQILADLGAEVIKVERPDGGDPARSIDPALFAAINRGKRGVALDLRRAQDRDHLDALVRTADIVVEGFRPGVAERLGAGYERLRALRPGLIYCSISGYGQEGPDRDFAGHDVNYLGVAGALDPPPAPGQPPRHFITVPMADVAAALFAANAILAALLRRNQLRVVGVEDGSREDGGRKDGGAYLDVSLAGSALALMSGRLDNRRARALGGGGYGAYVAADGRALTVACIEDAFWRRLCVALGRPELADAPSWATYARRRVDAERIDALLATEFAQRPRADWLDLLRAADVPAAPVNSPAEVPDDPYVAASGLLIRTEDGGETVWAVRYPARMPGLVVPPGTPDTRRAPALGEHNATPLEAIARTPGEDMR